MKTKPTVFLTESGVIAAIYTVLTVCLAPLSFGPVQLRLSEAMTVLPLFTPAAIPGLFAGCILSNLIGVVSGSNIAGFADVIIGSAATLIAALLTAAWRRVRIFGLPLLAFLPPVIVNALLVGGELFLFLPREYALFFSLASVGAGQAVSVLIGGGALYMFLSKHNIFKSLY